MPADNLLNISLPDDIMRMVEGKVASGEYLSESDVIQDGLRILQDRDLELESWLRDEAVPTYEAHLANPTNVKTIEEVFEGLEQRYLDHKARRDG